MPVSGLVLTPRGDVHALASALGGDARVHVGRAQGVRLPVVIEAPTLPAAEALAEELAAREDVLFVDVVGVDFSDLDEDAVAARPDGRAGGGPDARGRPDGAPGARDGRARR